MFSRRLPPFEAPSVQAGVGSRKVSSSRRVQPRGGPYGKIPTANWARHFECRRVRPRYRWRYDRTARTQSSTRRRPEELSKDPDLADREGRRCHAVCGRCAAEMKSCRDTYGLEV